VRPPSEKACSARATMKWMHMPVSASGQLTTTAIDEGYPWGIVGLALGVGTSPSERPRQADTGGGGSSSRSSGGQPGARAVAKNNEKGNQPERNEKTPAVAPGTSIVA
jgi:hypothetical protein